MEKYEPKKKHSVLRILLIFITTVLTLVFVLWSGLNLLKYRIYDYYYSLETDICMNPGLNDDFIPQGLAAIEDRGVYITSGYMKGKSNSRIYITNTKNESHYVKLTKNGKDFFGHVGGVATTGKNVYLSNDENIYILDRDLLLDKNTKTIDIGNGIKVNNSASFVFTDDTHLYVGEFHDGKQYVCNHPYMTSEGMHYAIVSQYRLDNLETPEAIYSIRNKVQGFAITAQNKVVLSTSYGLDNSVYYVYDLKKATASEEILDGAKVFYLDNVQKSFIGPAMGEDLDYSRGKIITLTESACNKYIFGKFFFADKIVALEIK